MPSSTTPGSHTRAFLLFALLALATHGCSCKDDELGPGDGGGDGAIDGDVLPPPPVGCGNGTLASPEACDDGNNVNGDGCSYDCATIDPRYLCPTPGTACVRVITCGNSRIEGDETCDDGNTAATDGCDADCHRQDGWSCPTVGATCVATECGDGKLAGFETCDDDNTTSNDGCSSTCVLEEGHHCPTPGGSCMALTTCGDNLVQGTEQCDDGQIPPRPYDGCDTRCKWEPSCAHGVCTPNCGDGIILPGSVPAEQCDDGNVLAGDGCSSTCTIEQGFTCSLQADPAPTTVSLTGIVRDFRTCGGAGCTYESASDTQYATAPNHPDFQMEPGGSLMRTFVGDDLNASGRPVLSASWVANPTSGTANDSDNESAPHSAASFAQWFADDATVNHTILHPFVLTSNGMPTPTYQFPAPPATDGPDYFPADALGWNTTGTANFEAGRNNGHNFHFTTEIRYWFEYAGNERLRFVGDDDLWVFVDGRRCLDIGGQHGAEQGIMDFGDPTQGVNAGEDALVLACRTVLEQRRTDLRNQTGDPTLNPVFEMAIFNAERHTTQSNFFLQLGNFVKRRSSCTSPCGDGTRASDEACDLGAAGNGGTPYGGCTTSCTLESYCGDGVTDGAFGETCDDGINLGGSASACAPGCMSTGATCGDGVTQLSAGEQCDDGNTTSNDGCSGECIIEVE